MKNMFYKQRCWSYKSVTYNLLNLITNKLLCSEISYILMQSMTVVKTYSLVISFSGERGMRIKQNSHPNPHQIFCLQHIINNLRYQMLNKTRIVRLCQDFPAYNKYFSPPGYLLLCSRRGRGQAEQSLSMVLHHAEFLKPTPELLEPGVSEHDFAVSDSSNWEAPQIVKTYSLMSNSPNSHGQKDYCGTELAWNQRHKQD